MENQLQEQMNNSAEQAVVAEVITMQPDSESTDLAVVGGNSFDYGTQLAALTVQQREKLAVLTEKINPKDVTTIQTYGYELNQIIANSGEELLKKARADNSSEAVAMTNSLLAHLNTIELDGLNQEESGFKKMLRKMPLIGRMFTSVEQILTKYDSISNNIAEIVNKMDTVRTVALRDNSTMESIRVATRSHINETRKLILALKLKEAELLEEERRMQQTDTVEAGDIQEMHNFISLVQKKINDLQVTEASFSQTLYHLSLAQINNVQISNQSEHIVNNVIPMWKSNIAVAIMIQNQKAAAEAERAVRDKTNEMLLANSAALKSNTTTIAKMNEELTIKLETLRQTTKDIVDTINEVRRIQADGAKERAQVETELKQNMGRILESVQQAALPIK